MPRLFQSDNQYWPWQLCCLCSPRRQATQKLYSGQWSHEAWSRWHGDLVTWGANQKGLLQLLPCLARGTIKRIINVFYSLWWKTFWSCWTWRILTRSRRYWTLGCLKTVLCAAAALWSCGCCIAGAQRGVAPAGPEPMALEGAACRRQLQPVPGRGPEAQVHWAGDCWILAPRHPWQQWGIVRFWQCSMGSTRKWKHYLIIMF